MADNETDYYSKFWDEKNARDTAEKKLVVARARIAELQSQREMLLSMLTKLEGKQWTS